MFSLSTAELLSRKKILDAFGTTPVFTKTRDESLRIKMGRDLDETERQLECVTATTIYRESTACNLSLFNVGILTRGNKALGNAKF